MTHTALRIATPDAPIRLHAPPSLAGLLFTGWQLGVPTSLSDANLAIDRASCRSMRCGSCRRRGLSYVPVHKGTAYDGVALCPRCGACERL